MAEPLFAASLTKLQRAAQFIQELEAEFTAHLAKNPYRGRLVADGEYNNLTIDWDGFGLVPGAIIGDAIHNMRTALDLMASDLARLAGKSPKHVYFPFGSTAESLDEAIKKKNFDKTGEDSVKLLREFEPYIGGKHRLRPIHDLDIEDKHSALIVAAVFLEVTMPSYIADRQLDISFPLGGNIPLVFPDDSALAGLPVIETLKELMKIVHGVIEAFASMVALRPKITS